MGHIIRVRDVIGNIVERRNINVSAENKEKIQRFLDNGETVADNLKEISREIPDGLGMIIGAASDNLKDYTIKLRSKFL